MATPTSLPYTSMSRTHFDIVATKAISVVRIGIRFSILRCLVFFSVGVAASFTTALPKPEQRSFVNSNVESTYAGAWPDAVAANNDQHRHVPSILTSAAAQVPACKRRCLDPHPGEFRYWYGQQNGCWVQVWRGWPEGCQHYQWYNTCNVSWDMHPNGAPRVYWSCCVH